MQQLQNPQLQANSSIGTKGNKANQNKSQGTP